MADASTGNLCTQIIHSHFGPLTATVARALLTRGRLTLPQLVRFTALKPQTVRAAVLVLLQHNVLWHALTEEDGEVLEFSTEECLMRLRFGRFVWQAEEMFGHAAAEIVQIILDHGKLQPPDILTYCSSGDVDGSKDRAKHSQALFKLVENMYLMPATVLSHISPRDKRIKYEEQEKAKISGLPTAGQLREAKEQAEVRIRREKEEEEKIGMKRKSKDQLGRSSKQHKLNGDDGVVVDDTVFFRLNFDRFNVHIRNKLIEKAVRERFNDGAACVMRAALKATEPTQNNLLDSISAPTSVANISMQISDSDNISEGLVYPKKVSNTTCIKDYLGLMSSADNPTSAGRAASFVSYSSSKVQIEFEIIATRMRRRVLEAVTREMHGSGGVRIVRLLMDTGKMDEKQISKVVMMSAKDVRPLLSALAADSLISTQEVPRTADRNPTRTFYLWHVDVQKVYTVILGNLYKTLYNIGMRKQAEKDEPIVKAVLEKRERTDIMEDGSLLTPFEKTVLEEWEKKQTRLAALEMRVEESIFVLRDLAVLG